MDPLEDKWCDGIWVGRSTLSDEHIVLTLKGVERTQSVKRKPVSERFSLKTLNAVAGLPWSPERHVLVNRCQRGSSVGRTVKADSVPEVPDDTPGCAGCVIPGWKHTQRCLKRTHEEQTTEKEEMKRKRCDKKLETKEDVLMQQGDTSGTRHAREPEEPLHEELVVCIEVATTEEQLYTVNKNASAQIEYELPDLNLEETEKFAESYGLDPELSQAGIQKELETLIQKGVYEEISVEDIPLYARIIGANTPKKDVQEPTSRTSSWSSSWTNKWRYNEEFRPVWARYWEAPFWRKVHPCRCTHGPFPCTKKAVRYYNFLCSQCSVRTISGELQCNAIVFVPDAECFQYTIQK
jgi:hypothetical protein